MSAKTKKNRRTKKATGVGDWRPPTPPKRTATGAHPPEPPQEYEAKVRPGHHVLGYTDAEARVVGALILDRQARGARVDAKTEAEAAEQNPRHPLRRLASLRWGEEDAIVREWRTDRIAKILSATYFVPITTGLRDAELGPPEPIEFVYVPADDVATGAEAGYAVLHPKQQTEREMLRQAMLWHFDRMWGYTTKYADTYAVWARIDAALERLRRQLVTDPLVGEEE